MVFVGMLFFFTPFLSAQDNYEIRKIKIRGNKTFSASELRDQMSFHQSNFISTRIQKKEASLYSSEFMESDIERLTRYYQSEGFLNVQVTFDSVSRNDKKRRVNIYISVQENEPVKVRRVRINADKREPAEVSSEELPRKLRRQLLLKRGTRFSDNSLRTDITTINGAFINLGYVYSQTNFNLRLMPDSNQTNILYRVTQGNICQFGETTIEGNRYIKEKYIRKQIAYTEGKTYNSDEIEKTRRQLYDLQLFRVVSISSVTDAKTQSNPIPMQIRIEEMPRWASKFGIGYGTEDKFRAFVDVTYRGLFGGTSRLNLYAKHSALTPYYISLAWIQPQFFYKRLSVSVNPYARRDNEPGYNTQAIGLNLPVGFNFNSRTRTSLAYYFEKVTQHIESNDADVPNPESDQYLYNKSGLSWQFAYNDASPVFSPEKGSAISMGAKLNGYIFGGDFDYTRLWIDLRKYQKFGRFVVAVRGMIGGIHSSDASGFIPVEDRFYSGGSNSNRGWGRSMIGPKRESGSPLGGKSIIEMNFEVRHPLFWRIELAAFMDISNIWEKSYHYTINNLAYAAGGGLRINTPIGPVRLDVGVPLWNEKKSVQFYISVGQAF